MNTGIKIFNQICNHFDSVALTHNVSYCVIGVKYQQAMFVFFFFFDYWNIGILKRLHFCNERKTNQYSIGFSCFITAITTRCCQIISMLMRTNVCRYVANFGCYHFANWNVNYVTSG